MDGGLFDLFLHRALRAREGFFEACALGNLVLKAVLGGFRVGHAVLEARLELVLGFLEDLFRFLEEGEVLAQLRAHIADGAQLLFGELAIRGLLAKFRIEPDEKLLALADLLFELVGARLAFALGLEVLAQFAVKFLKLGGECRQSLFDAAAFAAFAFQFRGRTSQRGDALADTPLAL